MQNIHCNFENKFWTILVGLTFFLSVQGYPFGMGITTTRLSIALLAISFLTQIALKGDIFFTPITLIPFFASSMAFVISVISFFLNGGEIWKSISWIFLGILGTLISIAALKIKREDIVLLIKFIFICSFLLICLTFYDLIKSGIFSMGGNSVRNYYMDQDFSDLNRNMNTIFVYSSFFLGVFYCNTVKSLTWKMLFISFVVVSLALFLLSGSRQNIIAVFLYFIVVMVFFREKGNFVFNIAKNLFRFIFILSFIIAVIVIAIKMNLIDPIWIQRRFFPFFLEQQITSGDECRIAAALNAISCSLRNTGFGIGPGNFPPPGTTPGAHNGYLNFLAENGIVLGIFAILFVYFLIAFAFFKKENRNWPMNMIMWSIFIIIAVLLSNLKDLFMEPIYWSTLGLSIGLSSEKSCIT